MGKRYPTIRAPNPADDDCLTPAQRTSPLGREDLLGLPHLK